DGGVVGVAAVTPRAVGVLPGGQPLQALVDGLLGAVVDLHVGTSRRGADREEGQQREQGEEITAHMGSSNRRRYKPEAQARDGACPSLALRACRAQAQGRSAVAGGLLLGRGLAAGDVGEVLLDLRRVLRRQPPAAGLADHLALPRRQVQERAVALL